MSLSDLGCALWVHRSSALYEQGLHRVLLAFCPVCVLPSSRGSLFLARAHFLARRGVICCSVAIINFLGFI